MEQVYIKDQQGNEVLPITHVNAVRDDQGNTLASILGAFEDEVSEALENVATLNSSGKIPTSMLPSYVDEVVEGYYNDADGKFYSTKSGSSYSDLITGEDGVVYSDLDTNATYRCSNVTNQTFVPIRGDLTLGETSSTAYRGDRGKELYEIVGPNDISEFDDTKAYSVNDFVVYGGKLYKFIKEHAAGAWDSSDVKLTNIASEVLKKGERISVEATADSGSVSTTAVLKIKVEGIVVKQGTGSVETSLPYGTIYTVEAERVDDYVTPAVRTFTANTTVRIINMAYAYIERDTITIDQTVTNDQSMISGDVQGDVIKAIRAASHLYLGTQTETGNQLICQLKDTDGTKYADGTTAAMDGSEGDQWLKLPVFWWKVTPIGTAAEDGSYDQYSFSFAFAGEPDPSWHKWEGDTNLLGAKKMYVTGGKGYSRSGIQGSANFTQAQGNTYASARGTGYSCVTWEWQWMMCILFYAWYGRTNSQAQCGFGSNSNIRTLGTKDSLGMTDTTSSNGNSDNTKFWGIENWWGDLTEWIGNITSQDYVVTIVDMNTKQSRQVSGWYPFGGTGGYASRFKVTDLLDFIPRAKNGTETTCYCDWVNGNTGARVVHRSNSNAYPSGGVAYVYSYADPSDAYAHIGSRLAFNGTITEAESVAAYKAALPS